MATFPSPDPVSIMYTTVRGVSISWYVYCVNHIELPHPPTSKLVFFDFCFLPSCRKHQRLTFAVMGSCSPFVCSHSLSLQQDMSSWMEKEKDGVVNVPLPADRFQIDMMCISDSLCLFRLGVCDWPVLERRRQPPVHIQSNISLSFQLSERSIAFSRRRKYRKMSKQGFVYFPALGYFESSFLPF